MATPQQDRLKGGVEKIIRAVFGPRIDYLAPYSCVVVKQNADGSLDVQPDDPRMPGLQGIPIDYGVPGVTATVAAGARCLLMFLSGDPSKPRATLWESASVTQLTVTATNVVVASSSTKIGSASASQAYVLGGQFSTHMTALSSALNALNAAITPLMLPPAVGAAKAAIQLAITAANNLAGDISSTVFGTP